MSTQNFFRILALSGIAVSSKKLVLFFLNHAVPMRLLRIKISPSILKKYTFAPKEFSRFISYISTGPALKTTGFQRHTSSDDLILNYAKKINRGSIQISDIGASDGSSDLYLVDGIKKLDKRTSVGLFDKFNYLTIIQKWGFIAMYVNTENIVVYAEVGPIIIFVYPFEIVSEQSGEKISFDNPILKTHSLKVEYFDVFKSRLEKKADIIKCANILTPTYFSRDEILSGLRNIHRNLSEGGTLFLIHNSPGNKRESLLVLRKDNQKFKVEKNINSNLISYLEISDTIDFD